MKVYAYKCSTRTKPKGCGYAWTTSASPAENRRFTGQPIRCPKCGNLAFYDGERDEPERTEP